MLNECKHKITASDRERIETGGPLNIPERVMVELMIRGYFKWVTGGRPVTLEWSRETAPGWVDTIHVRGTPTAHWGGDTLYPGKEIRQWVLSYFAEDEPEPEPENGLLVDAETADWLSAL